MSSLSFTKTGGTEMTGSSCQ